MLSILIQVEEKGYLEKFTWKVLPSPACSFFSLLSAVALSTRDGFFSALWTKSRFWVFLNSDKNIFGCVGMELMQAPAKIQGEKRNNNCTNSKLNPSPQYLITYLLYLAIVLLSKE